MLRPEDDVNVQPKPVYGDLHPLGDGIHPTDAVENDVHGGNEDLPRAIGGEEVAKEVEVLALKEDE